MITNRQSCPDAEHFPDRAEVWCNQPHPSPLTSRAHISLCATEAGVEPDRSTTKLENAPSGECSREPEK